MNATEARSGSTLRTIVSKVPEVTIWFWIIKIMATTVGETAADYLGEHFNLSLTNTTLIMSAVLAVALMFQFRAKGYVPPIYWTAVVLISIVGTLITDNLVDNFGVGLETTTAVFSVALAVTFAVWYRSEGTLAIHSIYTPKREGFYWLAILFTFALGTAAGDYIAETLDIGYWKSAIMFGVAIGLVTVAWRATKVNPVLTFWVAYILTRPLGASLGDYFSQHKSDGGLELGTTVTSAIFLATILAVVVYLSVSKEDVEVVTAPEASSVGRSSRVGRA